MKTTIKPVIMNEIRVSDINSMVMILTKYIFITINVRNVKMSI
jgi:hypothetical protein